MRFVADTNVIVPALVFGGVPRRVMEVSEDPRYEWFYSAAIQEEVARVLAQKFGWNDIRIHEVLREFWTAGTLVVPRDAVEAVPDDPDDNRILECAVSARARFLVSGDGHLLRLRSYRSVSIVTPREFALTVGPKL